MSSMVRRARALRCPASNQMLRPPLRPKQDRGQDADRPPPSARQQQEQQHQQRPTGQQQQQQQRLLSRPDRMAVGPSPEQLAAAAAAAARKVELLNDEDSRLAAFDALQLEVSSPPGRRRPRTAASFNRGSGKMRPVMAANMARARLHRPTPLQGLLLPAIRNGSDVLASAPPGAGSSTAALLGVLSLLLCTPRSLPRKNRALPLALLLCPSRELAMQLAAEGSRLVSGSQLTVKCATGGAPTTQQVLELRKGADLLVVTPGRLLDLLAIKAVSLARTMILVLEEVDELLGPTFLPLTRQLLHHPSLLPPQQRQTIALGSSAITQQQLAAAAADVIKPEAVVIRATWQQQPLQQQQQRPLQQQQRYYSQQQQSPASLLHPGQAQLSALLADPAAALAASASAAAAAVPPWVSQRCLGVAAALKMRCLLRLLAGTGAGGGEGLVLVFTNTHGAADEVWRQLDGAGVSAGVLHYARSQLQRDEALQCFKFGVTQVLVACGIAYRGLDLPDVAQVVNYDVPMSAAEYARRLGRAGRAGKPGVGTTLVTPSDGAAVAPVVAVMRAGGQPVPEWLQALADGTTDGGGAAVAAGESASAEGAASGSSERQQQGAVEEAGEQQSSSSNIGSHAPVSHMFRLARGGGRQPPQFGSYLQQPTAAAAEMMSQE